MHISLLSNYYFTIVIVMNIYYQNMMMEEIPEELISDCVQLVKANSIVGGLVS